MEYIFVGISLTNNNGQINSNKWTRSNNEINNYFIPVGNRLHMEAMAMEIIE